jgi:hypothetical protein
MFDPQEKRGEERGERREEREDQALFARRLPSFSSFATTHRIPLQLN